MCIVDMIIQVNTDDLIERIDYYGDDVGWFAAIPRESYEMAPLTSIFGPLTSHEVIEFHNRFYKHQTIALPSGKQVFLSSESLMKHLFEETLHKVAEGIQVFDRNGHFVYGNAASEQLEEYDQKSFQGKHLLDLYNLSEEFSTTLSVIRTGEPVLNRCDRFRRKDNKELVTINSGYPLKINDSIYGAATFESDLSVINNIKNRSFDLESFIRNDQPIIGKDHFTFDDIIHVSESMAKNIQFAKKIALNNSSILITGETGTGKELFAQSIHSYSPRRDKPFVDVNCSAVPSNLIESLFFGTERGAFTGSMEKKGFFEVANGGTLFLDEINSMSLDMQAKLLRVLQEKRYRRVGSNAYHKCDIRIIAASNQDLLALSQQHLIRMDFYYRISTLTINLLPLKDRKKDIPVLAHHFLKHLCREYGRPILQVHDDVLHALTRYDWPGNARELHHVIEYALNHVSPEDSVLHLHTLPDYMRSEKDVSHKHVLPNATDPFESSSTKFTIHTQSLDEQLLAHERRIVEDALQRCNGNVTKTAEALGLSRQSMQYRIKKLNLK